MPLSMGPSSLSGTNFPRFAFCGLFLSVVLTACPSATDDSVGLCADVPAPQAELLDLELETLEVSRHNLRKWIEWLTSSKLRGRRAGDPGARDAAAGVASQMERLSLVPWPRAQGTYCQGFPFFEGDDFNVLGSVGQEPSPSAGSVDPRPVILLSAHYDGQGLHPAGRLYPGADDNASGVAALLEVARLVTLRRALSNASRPEVGWIFAAFGAEEGGRMGARAFVNAPGIDPSRIALAINLDMVGRPWPGDREDALGYQLSGRSVSKSLARLRAAAESASLEIRPLDGLGERMPAISDAHVLAEQWPTLLLSTGLHEDHHQLTDTMDKLDEDQIERTVRLVLALGFIISDL